jgi:hypothetical protein
MHHNITHIHEIRNIPYDIVYDNLKTSSQQAKQLLRCSQSRCFSLMDGKRVSSLQRCQACSRNYSRVSSLFMSSQNNWNYVRLFNLICTKIVTGCF